MRLICILLFSYGIIKVAKRRSAYKSRSQKKHAQDYIWSPYKVKWEINLAVLIKFRELLVDH